eukprot:jgi/Ulvmu1/60/UM001_0063.1
MLGRDGFCLQRPGAAARLRELSTTPCIVTTDPSHPEHTMNQQSILLLLLCTLAMFLSSGPQAATAISTGRTLTELAPAPSPMSDDIESAEDVVDETGEEAEEIGDDIDSGVNTAVDEVDDAGEEAVDEVDEAFTGSAAMDRRAATAVVAAAVAGLFFGM